MKSHIRHLVADALHTTKSYSLPSVCERLGMEPGDADEAFRSKKQYVIRRLEKLSDAKVLDVAKAVLKDTTDEPLQCAVEQLESGGHLVSDVTRHHLAEALDRFDLSGRRDLMEMLHTHWPALQTTPSYKDPFRTLADDILQHAIKNPDWDNSDVLERSGFLTCSQARLFRFLEDILHPIRRGQSEREEIVSTLNPILVRDGYILEPSGQISGYPVYAVCQTMAAGMQPADALISEVLVSFDEIGVHYAWTKALDRRAADPEGAITAAKTLLETVCKHILDEAEQSYSETDDLPTLYNSTAEILNLAPSQHTETVFRSILGNCQSVVGNLSAMRNKLGDSHGKGKRGVKPKARHAELAVNLAGSMAMFLISTRNGRNSH